MLLHLLTRLLRLLLIRCGLLHIRRAFLDVVSCHVLLLRDWIYANRGCTAVANLCLCIIAPAQLILQVIA